MVSKWVSHKIYIHAASKWKYAREKIFTYVFFNVLFFIVTHDNWWTHAVRFETSPIVFHELEQSSVVKPCCSFLQAFGEMSHFTTLPASPSKDRFPFFQVVPTGILFEFSSTVWDEEQIPHSCSVHKCSLRVSLGSYEASAVRLISSVSSLLLMQASLLVLLSRSARKHCLGKREGIMCIQLFKAALRITFISFFTFKTAAAAITKHTVLHNVSYCTLNFDLLLIHPSQYVVQNFE